MTKIEHTADEGDTWTECWPIGVHPDVEAVPVSFGPGKGYTFVHPMTLRFADSRQSVYNRRQRLVDILGGPRPGVMHEVDRAFYKLAISQRDQAWEDIGRLRRQLVCYTPPPHQDGAPLRIPEAELPGMRAVLDRAMNTWEPAKQPPWLTELSDEVDRRISGTASAR